MVLRLLADNGEAWLAEHFNAGEQLERVGDSGAVGPVQGDGDAGGRRTPWRRCRPAARAPDE
jgi:hypothetical protein